ncbi:hypothetical protein NDU88_002461 [Pleurodeles waltl]|uniref:Uncharacterized protein n=1 Tax=Pleurodeles waltl TaxID=8319 RepID=A0AAV7W4M0_PLEWA|nr:hypothetical protein NDU88_002461 [Pleurodeles waltl]
MWTAFLSPINSDDSGAEEKPKTKPSKDRSEPFGNDVLYIAAKQCNNKEIQKRLRVARNPTLRDAISIVKVLEQSNLCMEELKKKIKEIKSRK